MNSGSSLRYKHLQSRSGKEAKWTCVILAFPLLYVSHQCASAQIQTLKWEAAWCSVLLFDCAMCSLSGFFPFPFFLIFSEQSRWNWLLVSNLLSFSLLWGRVAKKDFVLFHFACKAMGSQIWLQIIYIVFMKKNIFIFLALGSIACWGQGADVVLWFLSHSYPNWQDLSTPEDACG